MHIDLNRPITEHECKRVIEKYNLRVSEFIKIFVLTEEECRYYLPINGGFNPPPKYLSVLMKIALNDPSIMIMLANEAGVTIEYKSIENDYVKKEDFSKLIDIVGQMNERIDLLANKKNVHWTAL